MSKKNSFQELIESHLDKAVMGLIIAASAVALFRFVLVTPYGAVVDGQRLGPGNIDQRNKRHAQILVEQLSEPAQPMRYDLNLTQDFERIFQNTAPKLNIALAFPYPAQGGQAVQEQRQYAAPEVPRLTDAQARAVRGAAHIPIDPVAPENPYASAATELGDIDLVTVSGRFDLPALIRNFQQSFMGPRLNAAWRDPVLARPVFARVDLQRRQQNPDGSWSDWQRVPRAKIDAFGAMMDKTPLTVEEMEYGGVSLWIRQYDEPRAQINALQPIAYDFASLETQWLPPKLLEEAEAILKRQKEQQQRQARDERTRAAQPRDMGMPGMPGMPGAPAMGGPQPEPRAARGGRRQDTPPAAGPGMPAQPADGAGRTPAKRERTLDDVYKDFQKERLTEQTKLDSLRDSILVWAHDDTVQPGQRYQYRARIGVFNPVAGRGWLDGGDSSADKQTIFWSPFVEIAKPVDIPKMLDIFPMEVAYKQQNPTVKVEVARYYLGRWRTQSFEVAAGQVIGRAVESAPSDTTQQTTATTAESELVKKIDFTTPFTMVDAFSVVDWGAPSNPNRREMPVLLYCQTQDRLLTMPIGRGNWTVEARRVYTEIKDNEQNAPPLNTTRSGAPGMMPQTPGMMPGAPMPGMPGMPIMPGMPGMPMPGMEQMY